MTGLKFPRLQVARYMTDMMVTSEGGSTNTWDAPGGGALRGTCLGPNMGLIHVGVMVSVWGGSPNPRLTDVLADQTARTN